MARIITSQHFTNDAIVADKIAAADFAVSLSPEFEFEGETYQVVVDGHHSLMAAIEAGAAPEWHVVDKRCHDAIAVLDDGDVEGFLDIMHAGEGDWIDAVTRKAVW